MQYSTTYCRRHRRSPTTDEETAPINLRSNSLLAYLVVILMIFAPGFAISALDAQTAATLTGTIVDASAAALPGVSVTLRQPGTGLSRTATTGPDGRYVLAGMPAGAYELRAELAGFRPLVRTQLILTVGETATLPLAMVIRSALDHLWAALIDSTKSCFPCTRDGDA